LGSVRTAALVPRYLLHRADAAEASQRPTLRGWRACFGRARPDFHAPRRVDYRTGATRESAAALPAPEPSSSQAHRDICPSICRRIFPRGRISSSLKPLGSSDVKKFGGRGDAQEILYCFHFCSRRGVIAARAQRRQPHASSQKRSNGQSLCPPP